MKTDLKSGFDEDVSLIEMTMDHLQEVMRIERAAYPFPWTKSMFETSLASKDECSILLHEGKIVGYVIVSYVLDEAHLLNLCIAPECQGEGFGRLLLRCVIDKAKKKLSKLFFLEVRVSNIQAINLYFSEGFNEVGIRPNYYPGEKGREDAMLMTLDLCVDLFV